MTNLEIINDLIKKGYVYHRDNKLIEVVKDNWCFVKDSNGREDMIRIEYIVNEFKEKEEKKKEIRDAQKGIPVVKQYFEKHGVFYSPWVKPQYTHTLYNSHIIYDGRWKKDMWNTEVDTLGVHVTEYTDINRSRRRAGQVFNTGLTISKNTNTLIDGKIIDGEPNLRYCHKDKGYQLHKDKTLKSHCKFETWKNDIDHSFKLFIDIVKSKIKDEPIQYDEKTGMMYQSSMGKYIFQLTCENKNSQHGWDSIPALNFYCHEFFDKKYRDIEIEWKTVPKFSVENTKTKEEVIANITTKFYKMIEENGVLAPFKYE